ncbi:MAG TPA: hypothetical protein VGB37_05330 [Candidatus Lokiarchaeia archaeon]
MMFSFRYCKHARFIYCRKCKRNLNLYNYDNSDKIRIWLMTPDCDNDTCYDFVKAGK